MTDRRWMWVAGLACAAAGFLGGVRAVPVMAQEVELRDPVATYAEAFGLIGGVRELSNGSVLVADPLGGMFVRLDPGLAAAERIGTEGQGPGEYRQPDGVWPIGDDRSLLVDLGNARLTVVEPDGTLGEGTPIMLPSGDQGLGGMRMAIPGGTDDAGHVYFAGSAFSPAGMRDSVELYRLDLASSELETIAMLKAPGMTSQESGGANNQSVRVAPIPLSAADMWGIAPDGGLFIARSGDYSVEHMSPDGAIRRGDPIDFRPVRIGGAEKEEWDEERSRNGGIGVSVQVQNGRRQVSMSRATGGGSDLDALQWPDHKPPFMNSRVRIDADGNGWVRRSLKAGESALYDVFDGSGRLVRSVRFPNGRTLVAFGEGVLYVASTDAFDQQFLEKYAMP